MDKKRWIIFVVIVAGILGSLIFFSDSSKLDVSDIDVNAVQKANTQNGGIGDHIFGKVGSKVTLIEYGDYQCPPCGSIYPVVKSIAEKYANQLQFVFRNYPIPDSHPNAKAAAGSAEAAGLQSKFWEMHNKIYENQSGWSDLSITERGKFFENLAGGIGVDTKKFNSDLSKTDINKKISYDFALGKKAGVDATPTFYLNGVKMTSAQYGTEAKFTETIVSAFKKAGVTLP